MVGMELATAPGLYHLSPEHVTESIVVSDRARTAKTCAFLVQENFAIPKSIPMTDVYQINAIDSNH